MTVKDDSMPKEQLFELRLYIAGQTPKSITALNNITAIVKSIWQENTQSKS
jgi:hypothetical protein